MLTKKREKSKKYPNSFIVLVFATFIDRLGGFLLFPFFSIYVLLHFGVTEIEVGILFSIFASGSIIGSLVGGALTDKYGRKTMAIFGLVSSGIGSILMGIVNELYLFFIIAAVLGVLGDLGGPARQAMVVDLLSEDRRADGFGLLRVAVNLAAVIGPILGGFLYKYSFLLLFILDAVSSLITALIVFVVIPETKPERQTDKPEESFIITLKGYIEVIKDYIYIIFLVISALTVLVYMQMNSMLSVFLLNEYAFPPEWFGLLLSMNALMVVILQFMITRWTAKYAPMKMMVLGTFLYMIGFSMYGFVTEWYLFFVAMAILTVGEMIDIPVSQAVVARFAPEDKRGRYMAVFGFHWSIPTLFGVYGASLVYKNLGANWVWYIAGILCFIAMIGFWILHSVTKERLRKTNENSIEDVSLEVSEEITE
ncbi:MAG: MDR family MFS transporter [Candidatus Hermodarchaeota archaeon]